MPLTKAHHGPTLKINRLEKENAELVEYARQVTIALTGLVGGGSEMFTGQIGDHLYKADIPYCVQRIRDRFKTPQEALEQVRKDQVDETAL